MQIVIEINDIPKNDHERWVMSHGTPLPKGHGRLIDADDLYNQTAEWEAQALAQVERYSPEYSREEWRWWSAVLKERGGFKRDLENAQTILGADKESAE